MRIYEGIAAAADAVKRFYYKNEAAIPEHVRPRLEAAVATGSSAVDVCSTFVRIVYANRGAMPPEALEIAAGCADQFQQDGYHQRLDGRALGIRDALRRESGEPGNWPAPAEDPAVDREFVPPKPADAPAADIPAVRQPAPDGV